MPEKPALCIGGHVDAMPGSVTMTTRLTRLLSSLPLSRAWLLLGALALVSLASGCMTEPPDSDLPWNKPQSWEGSPALPPGMFQNP